MPSTLHISFKHLGLLICISYSESGQCVYPHPHERDCYPFGSEFCASPYCAKHIAQISEEDKADCCRNDVNHRPFQEANSLFYFRSFLFFGIFLILLLIKFSHHGQIYPCFGIFCNVLMFHILSHILHFAYIHYLASLSIKINSLAITLCNAHLSISCQLIGTELLSSAFKILSAVV